MSEEQARLARVERLINSGKNITVSVQDAGYLFDLVRAKDAEIARLKAEVERWKNLSINNPCHHTGFESIPCSICGYPDPSKMIAALKAENERLKLEIEAAKDSSDGWFNTWQGCDTNRQVLKQALKQALAALKAEVERGCLKDDTMCHVMQERDQLRASLDAAEEKVESLQEVILLRHIEWHLKGDQVVICKICGKDIHQIYEEQILGEP